MVSFWVVGSVLLNLFGSFCLGAPAALFTTIEASKYEFTAIQTVKGVSITTYNVFKTYVDLAIQYGLSQTMTGVISNDITVTGAQVSAVPSTSGPGNIDVTFHIEYDINTLGYTDDPQAAYEYLVDLITTAVTDGDLLNKLKAKAAAMGFPLSGITIDTAPVVSAYSAVETDSSGPGDGNTDTPGTASSSGSSESKWSKFRHNKTALGLSIAGAVLFVVFVVVMLIACRSSPTVAESKTVAVVGVSVGGRGGDIAMVSNHTAPSDDAAALDKYYGYNAAVVEGHHSAAVTEF